MRIIRKYCISAKWQRHALTEHFFYNQSENQAKNDIPLKKFLEVH